MKLPKRLTDLTKTKLSKLSVIAFAFVFAAVGSHFIFFSHASGYPVGDLNSDCSVNVLDLSILLSHWQQTGQGVVGDINGDGVVNILDLSTQLSHWGETCIQPPTNSALPTISGSAVVGGNMLSTTGTWTGNPASYSYQWLDCDSAGNNCKTIASATANTYVAASSDVNFTLRVTVTATNSSGSASATATPTSVVSAGSYALLPGEQIWKNGVSNLIFGTNDTGEWGYPNFEFSDSQAAPGTPNTVVQNAIKNAHFQLDRMFIPHIDEGTNQPMTDAEIAARVNTAANTNEQCLAVLQDINGGSTIPPGGTMTDLQFAEHVLTLTDGNHSGYAKCSMFEIGNEYDCGGNPPDQEYLGYWNTFVTTLRKMRPDAKFIGPVVGCDGVGVIYDWLNALVVNHYAYPDAISWHYYPCGNGWSSCPLSVTDQIVTDAQTVRDDLQSTLGYQIPIGISEWSADPNPSGTGNMAYTEPEMSNFVVAYLNSVMQAKLDFANIFCTQSYAAYGGLDMFDGNDVPRPYFNAYSNVISQYYP